MHKVFRSIHLASLVIMSGVLSSCVKDVILDAGDKTVVVECVLCDVPQQELRLSFSKGASETSVEELTEAVARLIDLTESDTVGEFKRDADGVWRLDYTAVPLHKYRLEVEVPGFDLIYAEDTMPDLVTIESHFNPVAPLEKRVRGPLIPQGSPRIYHTSPWFSYPSYLYSGEPNPHKLGKHIWLYAIRPIPSMTGFEFADYICCYSGGINYENYIDSFNVTDNVYNSPIIPTGFPIKNGDDSYPTYLSFCHSLNDCPIHSEFIRIEEPDPTFFGYISLWCSFFDMDAIESEFAAISNSDHNFSADVQRIMALYDHLTEIEGAFLNNGYVPSSADGSFVFKYVSDTYNQYFEDASFQIRRQKKESTDMSEMSIYLRENIFSNIKGGAGIFATSTEKRFPLTISPDFIFDFSDPL